MNECLRTAESALESEEMMAALLGLTTFGFSSAIIIFTWLFLFVFIAAFYVVATIPIYKMAKRAGIPHAWLAWIPVGDMYVRLKLSKREFNIFNWIKTPNRDKAFEWYLWLVGGMVLVIAFVLAMAFVPFIQVIAIILYYIAMAIFPIIFGIFIWRVNYDILMTYGMQEHALWASIVNYFCAYIMIVFSYIIMNRDPDYTV